MAVWGWEVEFLLQRCRDRIDLWKSHGVLRASLDYSAASNLAPSFSSLLNMGREAVLQRMREKYPAATSTPALADLLEKLSLSPDVLARVACLLELEAVVEEAFQVVEAEPMASVVLAVVGELKNAALTSNDKDLKGLLTASWQQLCELITETARDFASFIKQRECRRNIVNPELQTAERGTSIISTNEFCDGHMCRALLSSSLVSQWWRAMQLFRAGPDGAAKLSAAVTRAVPLMNRFRRLMLTRFLHALCEPGLSHIEARAPPFGLVRCVFDAFLRASPVDWPFESQTQLQAIFTCPNLPMEMRRELRRIICIPDAVTLTRMDDDDIDLSLRREFIPARKVTPGPWHEALLHIHNEQTRFEQSLREDDPVFFEKLFRMV